MRRMTALTLDEFVAMDVGATTHSRHSIFWFGNVRVCGGDTCRRGYPLA
jgi:hypothetical protein